ncbi:MAG TPA: hypothetical protein VMZ29_03280 [Candidatus Bathyarchaeia archaeon]|nr:hypothetical protein [Candidatus Bathyarchaeia archaeon]
MKGTLENQKKEEIRSDSKHFQSSSVFVRTSFILGIITVFLTLVYIVTSGFLLHFGALPVNLICSVILALAVVGIILGAMSFRFSKNVYAIIGVIMNIVVLCVQILALIVGNDAV